MFAEPTWPRTMNMLSNPKRQEEMVELACRAVVCPAQCLDQVKINNAARGSTGVCVVV